MQKLTDRRGREWPIEEAFRPAPPVQAKTQTRMVDAVAEPPCEIPARSEPRPPARLSQVLTSSSSPPALQEQAVALRSSTGAAGSARSSGRPGICRRRRLQKSATKCEMTPLRKLRNRPRSGLAPRIVAVQEAIRELLEDDRRPYRDPERPRADNDGPPHRSEQADGLVPPPLPRRWPGGRGRTSSSGSRSFRVAMLRRPRLRPSLIPGALRLLPLGLYPPRVDQFAEISGERRMMGRSCCTSPTRKRGVPRSRFGLVVQQDRRRSFSSATRRGGAGPAWSRHRASCSHTSRPTSACTVDSPP